MRRDVLQALALIGMGIDPSLLVPRVASCIPALDDLTPVDGKASCRHCRRRIGLEDFDALNSTPCKAKEGTPLPLRRDKVLDHIFADGSRVEMMRTCCAWDNPNLAGPHGVGDHGWQPFWVRINQGEWLNLHVRSALRAQEGVAWVVVCDSAEDWTYAMGIKPTHWGV